MQGELAQTWFEYMDGWMDGWMDERTEEV